MAYGFSSFDSNAMKSSNPHSGIYEADTSRTLDLNGGNPACNQGGVAVMACDVYNHGTSEIAPTITAAVGGTNTSGPKVMACDFRNNREQEVNGTLQAKPGGGGSLNLNNVIRTNFDSQ